MIATGASVYGGGYGGGISVSPTTLINCLTSISASAGVQRSGSATINCDTEVTASGLSSVRSSGTVNCDTDITALANRYFNSSVIDCETVIDTFIGNNPAIKVYNTGVYQGMTEALNFVGATISYAENYFTITITGGDAVAVDYKIETVKVDNDVSYYGYALPGTATSASSWKIKKVDQLSGELVHWANGTADFDKVWDSYLSYSY